MSKVCKVCGVNKPLQEYARHYSYADRLDTRCKACEKIRRDKNRWDNKAFVRRFKTMKGCENCDFKGHHSAYDLAHLEMGTKDNSGSQVKRSRQAVDYDWGRARLKTEIKKCKVLCANCHRIETYNERNK